MSALQTLERALNVLELVGHTPSLTATEISKELGLNRTIVTRLIWSLVEVGLLVRDNDVYEPAPYVVDLSRATDSSLEKAKGDWLQALADELGVTIVVQGLDAVDAIVLVECVPNKSIGLVVRHEVGARTSLEKSASSAALLLALSTRNDPASQRILHKVSANRRAEVTGIAEQGYALSFDSVQPGACGMAVPITGRGSGVLSLAFLVPVGDMSRLTKMSPELTAAARQLSASDEGGGM